MADLTLTAYQEAERRATMEEGRHGFKIHAVVTAFVCALLVVINVTVASEFPWAIFPAVGMGIGLLAHWYFGVTHVEESSREHQADIERRAAA